MLFPSQVTSFIVLSTPINSDFVIFLSESLLSSIVAIIYLSPINLLLYINFGFSSAAYTFLLNDVTATSAITNTEIDLNILFNSLLFLPNNIATITNINIPAIINPVSFPVFGKLVFAVVVLFCPAI